MDEEDLQAVKVSVHFNYILHRNNVDDYSFAYLHNNMEEAEFILKCLEKSLVQFTRIMECKQTILFTCM